MEYYGIDCSGESTDCVTKATLSGSTPKQILTCDLQVNYGGLVEFPLVTDYLPTTLTGRSIQLLELQRLALELQEQQGLPRLQAPV